MSGHILKKLGPSGVMKYFARLIYRGQGIILCFHRVYPAVDSLKYPLIDTDHMTPDDLDSVMAYCDSRGCTFVAMDDIPDLLSVKRKKSPFVAVTFDDGYVDTMEHATPVMERYEAPFTVYASSGLPEQNLTLWLMRLEQMIAVRDEITIPEQDGGTNIPCRTQMEKFIAYRRAMRFSLSRQHGQREAIAALLDDDHCDVGSLTSLFLTTGQLKAFSHNALVTIGAHTVTHANLAGLDENDARREMVESKQVLENRLGKPVDHIAYPFGAKEYAGKREFRLAHEVGYKTGVTYRHAHLFPEHTNHLTALPRLVIDTVSCRDPRRLRLYESGYMSMKQNRYKRIVTE